MNVDNFLRHQITIVIPAKNEAANIQQVLIDASAVSPNILVVDGHSTDGTADLARAQGARVILDHGKGKGDGIRTAIPEIKTSIAVFMDADGSHDPKDIAALVAPLLAGRADHVSGSRLIGGSSELHGGFDEFFRLAGSALITACINWRFGVRISESQNGFRAIRTEVLRDLDLQEDITTIEQEMVIKTVKKAYRLTEVPTHEYPRRSGTSNIRLTRVWFRYGWCVIKLLFLQTAAKPAGKE